MFRTLIVRTFAVGTFTVRTLIIGTFAVGAFIFGTIHVAHFVRFIDHGLRVGSLERDIPGMTRAGRCSKETA